MSTRFLLTCSCGRSIEIEAGAAGEKRPCACGKQWNIPTLREIRQLPQVAAAAPAPARSQWSLTQGILYAVGLSVLLIAGGFLVFFGFQRAQLDVRRPTVEDLQLPNFDQLALSQSWELWANLRDKKLGPRATPVYLTTRRRATQLGWQMILAGILFAAGGGFVWASLWVRRPRG